MPKGVGYDQTQFVRLNNERQLMQMAAPTTFVRLANDKRLDPQVASKPKRILHGPVHCSCNSHPKTGRE